MEPTPIYPIRYEPGYSMGFQTYSTEVKNAVRQLHVFSLCIVTVVFIHTMEDDQRLNTLVHEGDALHFSLQHCKKTENRCITHCSVIRHDRTRMNYNSFKIFPTTTDVPIHTTCYTLVQIFLPLPDFTIMKCSYPHSLLFPQPQKGLLALDYAEMNVYADTIKLLMPVTVVS